MSTHYSHLHNNYRLQVFPNVPCQVQGNFSLILITVIMKSQPENVPEKNNRVESALTGRNGRNAPVCVLRSLTLRLGAVVVEVLLPLRGDQLAHILDKQAVAAALRAQPAWTEEVRQQE